MTDDTRFRPRPTMFNGVMMRSRLEAGFAQWADMQGLGPDYEPCAFAGCDGQYLPDFRLRYVGVEGVHRSHPYDGAVWVEVKPSLPERGPARDEIQQRMEIIFDSEPDAVLVIAYKDPIPGLLVKIHSTGGWWPAVWTVGAGPYNIGIARPHPLQPWPDGYWRGPAWMEPEE